MLSAICAGVAPLIGVVLPGGQRCSHSLAMLAIREARVVPSAAAELWGKWVTALFLLFPFGHA